MILHVLLQKLRADKYDDPFPIESRSILSVLN